MPFDMPIIFQNLEVCSIGCTMFSTTAVTMSDLIPPPALFTETSILYTDENYGWTQGQIG